MSPRRAPALAALLTLLAAAACTGGAPVATPATSAPPPFETPTSRPTPTPVPMPSATASPNAGDVDGGGGGPQLTIEVLDDDSLLAMIEDPAAKGWRLVIAGVGARSDDRFEIVVETGDIGPLIQAIEVRGGEVVDVMDLTGLADSGTAAAGGCHRTLPVCVDSDGFRLPDGGDGTFGVELTLPDAGTPMLITGATATWPAEPFVLGPWTETEAFPWGEG
jgi:hypothetical protein